MPWYTTSTPVPDSDLGFMHVPDPSSGSTAEASREGAVIAPHHEDTTRTSHRTLELPKKAGNGIPNDVSKYLNEAYLRSLKLHP